MSAIPISVRAPLVAALIAAAAATAAAAPQHPDGVAPPTAPVTAAPPARVPPGATKVEVERVRPRAAKLTSLRFLRENRDFIRARFDLLRERPLDQRGEGLAIDARYLAYERMLAAIHAARESTAAVHNDVERRQLLASITELGRLEDQLDQMDQLLAGQRDRLQILEDDYTGRQRTALMVVVSGDPGDDVVEIAVTLEGGGRLAVPLFVAQRQALQQGGVVQVFHGFVEPRRQVIEVDLAGPPWPAGDRGFVTLEPARDRLTFLHLDLGAVRAVRGAPGIRASTWLHDPGPRPGAGG